MSDDPSRPSAEDKFDDFLDRLLGPEDEAAMTRQVASDPKLAKEARLQDQVDAELKAMYSYDESRAPVFPSEASAPIPFPKAQHTRPNRMWRSMAIAAALLLVGIGVRLSVFSSSGVTSRTVSPEKVYAKLMSRGFEPEFKCTSPDDFKRVTKERLGTSLAMAEAPNIELMGWAYNAGFPGKLIGDHTMLMLTKVDSKEVLVMMDYAASDRPLSIPAGSGLYLHRKVVGPVVNYEISPFATSKILDRLSMPN